MMKSTTEGTKALRLLVSVAILLATCTGAARGQSALDGFDPNANGTVRVVVVQPDGKILIGGDFTTLAPNGAAAVTRNCVARLNPDGTLDAAFNPNLCTLTPFRTLRIRPLVFSFVPFRAPFGFQQLLDSSQLFTSKAQVASGAFAPGSRTLMRPGAAVETIVGRRVAPHLPQTVLR